MSERALSVESSTDTLDLPAVPSPAIVQTHSLAVPQATNQLEREDSSSSFAGQIDGEESGSGTPAAGVGMEGVEESDGDSREGANELLETQEISAFGFTGGEDDGLPAPPREDGRGGRKGVNLAAQANARAKRPKNIKVSGGGGGKSLARRAVAAAEPEAGLPNNDFCDACQGKGQFVCCDGGCLRSFHLTCLEPPLELDDINDDPWYCKACRALADPPPKPPRGFFRELIYRVDCENPKQFALTQELKGMYKNVATGSNGEFIDTNEHRPPNKQTGRGPLEDRDGYRTKDRLGKTILCYHCSEAASVTKGRKIVSCDWCDQHWHLDCMDPPLVGMPPPGRKWMCPLHVDHILPRKRLPKGTTVRDIDGRGERNNGDIVVVSRKEKDKAKLEDFDELTVNRIRYQVPEETLILDFWARVGAAKSRPKPRVSHTGNDSPLTSLGEESDEDPPEVAKLGYSPYHSRTKNLYPTKPTPTAPAAKQEISAFDQLAALAEGFYALEHSSTDQAMDVDAGSPSLDKGKSRATSSLGKNDSLLVETKEDLKALMHIRKMMTSQATWNDPKQKATLMGFFQGDAIIPQLSFLQNRSSPPWDLPWDGEKQNARPAK